MAKEIKITLPDGSAKIFPYGVSGEDVAKSISERLLNSAIALKVDGEETPKDTFTPGTNVTCPGKGPSPLSIFCLLY
ncbi:MAG: TGS domain-containing protein, partial [Acidobacteria bacterium]|nr:TGS domain-containing protein [Acidobacteriota bacterium]